jgi:hypothetical protein
MVETAQDIIARIRSREQERAYLLDQLDLWAKAQAQGINPDTVHGFGLDSRLLTERQERDFHRRTGVYIETLPSGRKRPVLFNCVWHHDGSQTTLDPMLKAIYRHDDNQ